MRAGCVLRAAGGLAAVLLLAGVAVFIGVARLSARRGRSRRRRSSSSPRAQACTRSPTALARDRHRRPSPGSSSPARYADRHARTSSRPANTNSPPAISPAASPTHRQRQGRAAPLTMPEGLTSAESWRCSMPRRRSTGTIAPPPPEGSFLPDTYFYVLRQHARGAARSACSARWSERSPSSGRSARPTCRSRARAEARDPRLDRREGDRAARRARAHRRRLRRPAQARHAAAGRSDRDLRADRRRQGAARRIRSTTPISPSSRPTTPISTRACRRRRSTIPASPRSTAALAARRPRRALFRRRRHRAATPSPRPSPSTTATSPSCGSLPRRLERRIVARHGRAGIKRRHDDCEHDRLRPRRGP